MPKKSKTKEVQNAGDPSYSFDPLAGVFGQPGSNPASDPFTLGLANQYNPITLNRLILSYAYATHGVLQTVIDQPIEDAFRGGLKFKCDELDNEELKLLEKYLITPRKVDSFRLTNVLSDWKEVMAWAALFGGGGLIINTQQNPMEPLDIGKIKQDEEIAFIPADRWELSLVGLRSAVINTLSFKQSECPYDYYGQPIHWTRVLKVNGKEAPSFLRRRLQGWGMSRVEHLIRNLNSAIKYQDVVFELLDEAKVDVLGIDGYNARAGNAKAMSSMQNMAKTIAMAKNYKNMIVMDKNDTYDQKQLNVSGLSNILEQIRVGQAADSKIPMTKLFGLSPAGFNSGESERQNYNDLVESEVRTPARIIIDGSLPIICQKLFGFYPESLTYEFMPLDRLTAKEEEERKTSVSNRLLQWFDKDLFSGKEVSEMGKQEGLLIINTEVLNGTREPDRTLSMGMAQGNEPDGKQ